VQGLQPRSFETLEEVGGCRRHAVEAFEVVSPTGSGEAPQVQEVARQVQEVARPEPGAADPQKAAAEIPTVVVVAREARGRWGCPVVGRLEIGVPWWSL